MTEKPTKGDIRRQRKYRRSLGMSLEGLLAIPKAPPGQGSHKTKRRAAGRKRAAASATRCTGKCPVNMEGMVSECTCHRKGEKSE